MAKQGFWANVVGTSSSPPRERFSLAELRHLRGVLLDNPVVTDANRDALVEALRSIAELMIWGDQHEPRFLDYFLENNLLQHFVRILQQRSNRQGDMAKQVLQTLSILIQNIRSKTAIYYLFSNNHLNEIVAMRFDFEDDEVLGYYIGLLKTMSLKLDRSTVQFFFHQDGERGTFPLYTEAVKLINHRDGMVRAAVRTLTLNVYSIPDPDVQAFVVSPPASNYFTELAIYIADQCQVLDRMLGQMDAAAPGSVHSVDSCLAEVEDLLSYCNDILGTGVPGLELELVACLWDSFALPVLLQPLLDQQRQSMGQAASKPRPGECLAKVRLVCALCILERLLHVMSYGPFIRLLAAAITVQPAAGDSSSCDMDSPVQARSKSGQGTHGPVNGHLPPQQDSELPPASWRLPVGGSTQTGAHESADPSSSQHGSGAAAVPEAEPLNGAQQPAEPSAVGSSSSSRQQQGPASPEGPPLLSGREATCAAHESEEALLSTIRACGSFQGAFVELLHLHEGVLTSAAVRVLVALLQSKAVTTGVLDAAGLLPLRHRKKRELLEQLTADGPLELGAEPGHGAVRSQAPAQQSPMQDRAGEGQQAAGEHGQQPAGAQDVQQSSAEHHLLDRDDLHSPQQPGNPQAAVQEPLNHHERPPGEGADGVAPEGLQSISQAGTSPDPPEGASPSGGPHMQGPAEARAAQNRPAEAAAAGPTRHQAGSKGPHHRLHSSVGSAAQPWVDALVGLLLLQLLPCGCLWGVGWLVHQLLGPCALSPLHWQLAEQALRKARGKLLEGLQGMWCDAIPLLIETEWPRARGALLQPHAPFTAHAVQAWMQAAQMQELAHSRSGPAGTASAASQSAQAAKWAHLIVQRFVALTQINQLLRSGQVWERAPVPAVSEPMLKAAEIREGAQVTLTDPTVCTVAFSRGQERQVFFAVQGLPQVASPPQGEDVQQLLASASIAAVPGVVLADPVSSQTSSGTVLSVAPLMGAAVHVDKSHARWLHVHVRPHVRGLLKVISHSNPGNIFVNLSRQLVDGHWVLSFATPERAMLAKDMVDQHAKQLRTLYADALSHIAMCPQ